MPSDASFPVARLAARVVLALWCVGLGWAVAPRVALAVPTVEVQNGDDAGAGSLRLAIADVDAGGTITFAAGVTAVDLTSGELVISKSLTIQGLGADILTVRRGAGAVTDFRVFHVTTGTVTISDLTVSNGRDPVGGGILVAGGSLSLTDATVSGNTAPADGGNGGLGAGILVTGASATVTNSTISGNSAVDGSNSRGQGGGLFNFSTLTVVNSTVSGNAAFFGAGIENQPAGGATATLSLSSSTVAGNTGPGAGVDTFAFNGSTPLTRVQGSIVAQNSGLNFLTSSEAGGTATLTSLGHNLVGDTSSGFTNGSNGDIVNVPALLGPLANNGGPTRTHAPLAGSPAINGGAGAPATDQRGLTRAGAAGADDIGAVEVQPPTLDLNGAAAGVDFGTTFSEDGSPVPLSAAGLVVSDLDSANLASATVTITDRFDGAAEMLTATESGGITAAYSSATGVLTLSGPASLASYQSVLGTVTYANSAQSPTTSARHVRFVLNDGVVNGPAATATVAVTTSNDVPTLATNAGLTVAEGAAGTIGAARLRVTDADTAASSLVYTIGTAPSHGTLTKAGSPLAASGAFTQADVDANVLTYTHDGSETTSDSFTFSVSDGAGGSISATSFAITVAPANDAPTLAAIADRATPESAPVTVPVTVGDPDTAVGSLTLTGISANQEVVANGGIAVGGAGTDRTLTITPVAGRTGTTVVTVAVSDGGLSATRTFILTVGSTVGRGQVRLTESTTLTVDSPTAVVLPGVPPVARLFVLGGIIDPGLDLSAFAPPCTGGATARTATLPARIVVDVDTGSGHLPLDLPAGLAITGPCSWSARLALPRIAPSLAQLRAPTAGDTVTLAVELGAGDTPLTLDRPVAVVLPGQGGQRAFTRSGGATTAIDRPCPSDPALLAAGEPCVQEARNGSGRDMIILTRQLGTFGSATNGCAPVPAVVIRTAAGGGVLTVTVSAGRNPIQARNVLKSIRIGAATNAQVEVPVQAGIATAHAGQRDFTITITPNTEDLTFMIRRQVAGQATHVPLVVTDNCGPWPTFVGGGAEAF